MARAKAAFRFGGSFRRAWTLTKRRCRKPLEPLIDLPRLMAEQSSGSRASVIPGRQRSVSKLIHRVEAAHMPTTTRTTANIFNRFLLQEAAP
jgi:hypothetical protein